MRNHYISRKIETTRIGFHYFPDTNHYTNRDLNTWLPRLNSLSAHWIVLNADATRAIPENFIHGLIDGGITPIVHIALPLPNTPSSNDIRAIIEAYARWGIRHIILFDQPNSLAAWSSSGWSQQDLVERFIDKFLPLALSVAQNGMTPVFPPLEAGGNYWDISFLKQSIKSIQRRGYSNLLKQMMIASYAHTFNHELDWGSGGPEKWPNVRPYDLNAESQDQRGFNQYQWLESTAIKLCEEEIPVILLGAGIKQLGKEYSPEIHTELVTSIIERLSGVPKIKEIPSYVKSCCFYLLASEATSEEYKFAWYRSGEEVLPIVSLLTQEPPPSNKHKGTEDSIPASESVNPGTIHPISHYLLLPIYEWGVAEYHLDVSRAFIQKNHPTVGFSLEEASLAQRVTVLGGQSSFPEEALNKLRSTGCLVERISGDGTSIATQLAER